MVSLAEAGLVWNERILCPFFWHGGTWTLDVALISHPTLTMMALSCYFLFSSFTDPLLFTAE